MAETKTILKGMTKNPVKLQGLSKSNPVKLQGIPKNRTELKAMPKEAQNRGFAVIETGGKQYRVAVGETIKIEKLQESLKVGDSVLFDKVLLVDNGDSTDIGTPYIPEAKVVGSVLEIGRNAKVMVIKYKQKSRYMKRNGHRQPFIKVLIEKIG